MPACLASPRNSGMSVALLMYDSKNSRRNANCPGVHPVMLFNRLGSAMMRSSSLARFHIWSWSASRNPYPPLSVVKA